MKATVTAALLLATPTTALPHSQLFLKAQMTVVSSAGNVSEIRSVWRYEPRSAAAIREAFDRDGNGSLDEGERGAIARAVREAKSPFTIRAHLVQNGREVPLGAPSGVRVDILGREIAISFSVRPTVQVRAGGRTALWAEDTENNSVLDFGRDGDLKASGPAFENCTREIVRPGRDSASRNQTMATDMFFGDPQRRDRPPLTSTRLEVDCPG